MPRRPPAFLLTGCLTVWLVHVPVHATAAPQDSGMRLFDVGFDFDLDSAIETSEDRPAEEEAPDQFVDPSAIAPGQSTWRGAVTDSIRLLMIEHAWRVAFQEKTRRELGGPFWGDYMRSVKIPSTWNDGDGWAINYVGHPIHGAASGFIWLDHEDGAHDPAIGFSNEYWASRGRAAAWAAGYSLQFEFGPISEASIGNVGLRDNTTGWVDHVVTPAGALAFMVAEDALDRYFIRLIEGWTTNRFFRAAVRMGLNPSRTLSNTAQGRLPWYRVGRPLGAAH